MKGRAVIICEPSHSIVQFPENDPDSGNNVRDRIDASSASKLGEWIKWIKGWFHCSALGAGHSELLRMMPAAHRLLPTPTYYEGHWWDRVVKIDGHRPFGGHQLDIKVADEVATEYGNRVVNGNLSMLRRFLEMSMRKSERPGMYVKTVCERLIVPKHRDDVWKNLKRFSNDLGIFRDKTTQNLEKVIKVILGATRKREWLCSAWADDSSLWTPGFTS